MKKLLSSSIILGIILLSSCNTTEEPSPKALQGTWSFVSDNTSGEFTVANIAGKEKINQGYFIVEGNTYTIDTSTELTTGIHLIDSSIALNFINYQIQPDYKVILSNYITLNKPGVPTKIFYETVICTKQ